MVKDVDTVASHVGQADMPELRAASRHADLQKAIKMESNRVVKTVELLRANPSIPTPLSDHATETKISPRQDFEIGRCYQPDHFEGLSFVSLKVCQLSFVNILLFVSALH